MRRSDQRRAAVVALYQHDVTGRPLTAVVPRDASLFTKEPVAGVEGEQEGIAALIERYSGAWTLDRTAPVERNILRWALPETPPRSDVPDEVAIDEAVEAAKELCSAEAPRFVNGILGAVQREDTHTA